MFSKKSMVTSIAIVIALAGLAMSLSSCSGSQKTPRTFADVTLPPQEGTPCQSHNMCLAGEACFQNVCVNMVNIACKSDLQCPEYEKCFNGTCAQCTADSDCANGLKCNSSGVCIPEKDGFEFCNSAKDCQNGEICFNGACSAFCVASSNPMSEKQFACMSKYNLYTGISTNLNTCKQLSRGDEIEYSCPDGFSCINNGCYPYTCKSDNDCEEEQVCSHGRCYTPECKSNDDCYSSQFCENGVCMTCHEDSDCESGLHCLNKPRYSMITYESDGSMTGIVSSTSKGKRCIECIDNSYCSGEKPFCDLNNNHCVACTSDYGCQNGLFCRDGLCKPECENDYECSGNGKCVNNVCFSCSNDDDCEGDFDGKHCMLVTYSGSYSCAGRDCNYGKYAQPKRKCVECAKDSDCKESGNICSEAGRCVECFLDRGCKEGFKCYGTTCKEIMPESENNVPSKPKIIKCDSQSDCEEGMFCNYEHKCQKVAKKCTVDTDCGEKGRCNRWGYCAVKQRTTMGIPIPEVCTEDSQCLHIGGAKCRLSQNSDKTQSSSGECRYLCTTNADCESNEACIDGACGKDIERHYCLSDEHCADGYACNTLYRECVKLAPESISDIANMEFSQAMSSVFDMMSAPDVMKIPIDCWHDSDCNGLRCLQNGTCGCMYSNECKAGQQCNSKNKCECATDEGCGEGFICKIDHFDSNVCLCRTDAACGAGKICTTDGKCRDDKDPDSLYERAKNYRYGYTNFTDSQKAIEFYKKAEEAGHPVAALELGMVYLDLAGDDPQKLDEAKKQIQKGLEQVDAIKKLTEKENASESEQNKVTYYYRCSEDISLSKAVLLLKGVVLTKDTEKALQMLQDLYDSDEYIAYYTLIKYYIENGEYRKGRRLIKDDSRGYTLTHETGASMLMLAKLIADSPQFMGSVASQFKIVGKLLKNATELGNAEAAFEYSGFCDLTEFRSSFSGDDEIELLEKASSSGYSAAAKRLEIVKANSEKYTKLINGRKYVEAAALGSVRGCEGVVEREDDEDAAKKCVDTFSNMLVGKYFNCLISPDSCEQVVDKHGYDEDEEEEDNFDEDDSEDEDFDEDDSDEYGMLMGVSQNA